MFTIILTVILIMPGATPNIQQSRAMSSLDACFQAARAWVEQDARGAGGIGFAAGCSSTAGPGRTVGAQ